MAEGGEIRAVAKGIADDVAKGMEDSTAAVERLTKEGADEAEAAVAEHQANDANVRDRLHAAASGPPAETIPPARPVTAAEQIKNGEQHTGRKLPQQGGPPGGTLYKQDPQTGQITNYTTYDADGNAIKRVDLTGRPHGGVPTPHVVEYDTNVNPNTGQVFVQQQRHVRPATPDEIP
jgi:Bacterial toxin 24